MTDHRSGTITDEELREIYAQEMEKIGFYDVVKSLRDGGRPQLWIVAGLAAMREVERRVLSHRTEPTSDDVERAAKAIYASNCEAAGFSRELANDAADKLFADPASFPDGIEDVTDLKRQARAVLSAASISTLPSPIPGAETSLATHKFATSDYIIDPVGPRPNSSTRESTIEECAVIADGYCSQPDMQNRDVYDATWDACAAAIANSIRELATRGGR